MRIQDFFRGAKKSGCVLSA